MAEQPFESRFYMIGRSDIPQMNAGKLAAQSAHAASEFEMDTKIISNTYIQDLVKAWRDDRKFGVTITLIGTDVEIRELLGPMRLKGYVRDPSYPMFNALGDGFVAPYDTVGWIFPTSRVEMNVIQNSGLDLYP